MNNIWLAFITGLTTGGISCFVVQGGLLTSSLVDEEVKIRKKMKVDSLFAFLGAKLVSYSILGAFLGALGASIHFSIHFQAWLQIAIGIFLLGTAGRLLNIHPFFRYFVITPPKPFLRFLRNRAKIKSIFTPAFLGAFTVLIPCGVTQAMMLIAIASGSALWGAAIMFAFTLGTTPIFFAIGLTAGVALKNKVFTTLAALVVFVIGISSLNNGQILRGSVHTAQNYWYALIGTYEEAKIAVIHGGVQRVTIKVTNNGYKADVNTLKAGVPVKLTLVSENVKNCAITFTIPELNFTKTLPQTGTEEVEFTPQKIGLLSYSCGMGMYSGAFNIIN